MTVGFGSSFSGRSVFVTGHTGFKGSWLVLWLAHLGAKVTGYSTAAPTNPSNFEASRIRDLLESHYTADIRDRGSLLAALRRATPEVVFHLAAQSLVRESYLSPYETFEVNVQGTAGVLDSVRSLGRPCVVIIVTSDKCYEPRADRRAHAETDPLGGFDPYSASKGAAEILTAAYRRSFFPSDQIGRHGVRVASARAGNVIGGGDWARNRIVPDIVEALSERRPVQVRNPGSVRPWQHVLEPLGGYLLLASRLLEQPSPALCSAWNFGPPEGGESTVRNLVERFIESWGGGTWNDCSDSSAPHEAPALRLSIERATRELGWTPRWTLEEAVGRTARWYRRYAESAEAARAACMEDLVAYQKAGS